MTECAKTCAEAEAQTFALPVCYEDWVEFAHLIDGYAIAQEMGLDALSWFAHHLNLFETEGTWEVETALELRLLLFFKARQLRFSYELEFETFPTVHSLFKTLAQKTGQPYDDPQAEARYVQEEATWETLTPDEQMAKSGIRIIKPDTDEFSEDET